MILVIDNYDSFVFNLVHYLRDLGAETEVVRNDAVTVEDALGSGAQGLLISPGPGAPEAAGISTALARAAAQAQLPVLGVCLGHQAIAAAFGATVGAAQEIRHGKTSPVRHDNAGVFAGLPSPFTATRYHSLAVVRDTIPAELTITAETEDGEVMGLAHVTAPVFGVQFHPESIASEHGHALLRNFLKRTQKPKARKRAAAKPAKPKAAPKARRKPASAAKTGRAR